MRVLVTGAAGFTGRYVVDALAERGHQPRPLTADLTDQAVVAEEVSRERVDAIVHLAGRAFVDSGDYAAFYAVNQLGSFHLLEAMARSHPGARVILASTANVYGATRSGRIDESMPPNPVGHYALSKWAMERGSAFWSDRLAITIVRPFNYTGVGQEPIYLIPKIVEAFRSGADQIQLGALDVRRDFGDVRDVAAVYVGLVEADGAAGRTFNICTGEAQSVREIVEIAAATSGRKLHVAIDPGLLRKSEIEYLAGENQALLSVLPDWSPRPVRDTIAWMLSA